MLRQNQHFWKTIRKQNHPNFSSNERLHYRHGLRKHACRKLSGQNNRFCALNGRGFLYRQNCTDSNSDLSQRMRNPRLKHIKNCLRIAQINYSKSVAGWLMRSSRSLSINGSIISSRFPLCMTISSFLSVKPILWSVIRFCG